MKKIIHAGDLHIGEAPYGSRALSKDVESFCGWLGDLVAGESPDLVVLAGDTFDSPRPSARDMGVLLALAYDVDRSGSSLAIVDGNHDSSVWARAGRGGKRGRPHGRWSSALARSFPKSVLVPSFGWSEWPDVPKPGGIRTRTGVRVIPMDYLPPEFARDTFSRLSRSVADHGSPADVLVAHQSMEWAVGGVFGHDLDKEALDGIAAYCALGDIHCMARRVSHGWVSAYSGPSTWMSSRESGKEGIWVVTVDGGRVSGMERRTPPEARGLARLVLDQDDGRLVASISGWTEEWAGSVMRKGRPDSARTVPDLVASLLGISGVLLEEDGLPAPPETGKVCLLVEFLEGSDVAGSQAARKVVDGISEMFSPEDFETATDSRSAASSSDVSGWIRRRHGDEDSVMDDGFFEEAIREAAHEAVPDDHERAERVASACRDIWRNPASAGSLVPRKDGGEGER